MKTVIVIGGGETHKSRSLYLTFLEDKIKYDPKPKKKEGWKTNLQKELGPDYLVCVPKMPNPLNANYEEWDIYFKKVLRAVLPSGPLTDVVLVGHSLGGLFLLKWLDEHNLYCCGVNARGTVFVATPVVAKGINDEGFGDFVCTDDGYTPFSNYGKVHIFQSEDDEIVQTYNGRVLKALFPDAEEHWFKDRGHFIYDRRIPGLATAIRQTFRRK
jgi:predicted alpha/beta hydrolase family esterase